MQPKMTTCDVFGHLRFQLKVILHFRFRFRWRIRTKTLKFKAAIVDRFKPVAKLLTDSA